jgi:hypothetical protein
MKQLWRIGLVALGLVFLVACGGGAVVIPDPISKVDAKEISDATVKSVVTEWQSTARKSVEQALSSLKQLSKQSIKVAPI